MSDPRPLPTPQTATVLAFDTSGPYCAAAVLQGGAIKDVRVEPMTRGQAERLMPLLAEMLQDNGIDWRDLDAVGVGIGPGNFTGIRIAVSAARGLALGLDVPAIGISGFQARGHLCPPPARVAIPAPRDHVYVADPDPRLIPAAEAVGAQTKAAPGDLARAIAHLAAARIGDASVPPAPLYVRAADAAPARDQPPVMLD